MFNWLRPQLWHWGGVALFIHISIKDAALDLPYDRRPDTLDWVLTLLLVAGPGILVVIGTYFQVIRDKVWAVAPIVLGAMFHFVSIFMNGMLLYSFNRDIFAQRLLTADFGALVLAVATSIFSGGVKVWRKATLDKHVGNDVGPKRESPPL